MNTFNECLAYEKGQLEIGDSFAAFYKEYKGLEGDIRRMSWSDPQGRFWQKKDIDLMIGDISISEKYRSYDFGDMLIELFSDCEEHRMGWGYEGRSDRIFYFVKELNKGIGPIMLDKVYVVDSGWVRRTASKYAGRPEIGQCIEDGDWKKINESGCYSQKITIGSEEVTVCRIPTYINNNIMWYGLGVCIPWDKIPHKEYVRKADNSWRLIKY